MAELWLHVVESEKVRMTTCSQTMIIGGAATVVQEMWEEEGSDRWDRDRTRSKQAGRLTDRTSET